MKIIHNGILREMTEEEIEAYKREQEFAKSLIIETAKEPFDELLDELENISSVKDIKNVAKKMKEKRGGKK